MVQKDETVMRALEESLGTSDLVDNPWPMLSEIPAYKTEDGKFQAYVTGLGTFVGTKAFMEHTVIPIFKELNKEPKK